MHISLGASGRFAEKGARPKFGHCCQRARDAAGTNADALDRYQDAALDAHTAHIASLMIMVGRRRQISHHARAEIS